MSSVSETFNSNFYPRPPRGGRRRGCGGLPLLCNFYPRPPRGGRPLNIGESPSVANISIHALREEGDLDRLDVEAEKGISIHALREEGDNSGSLTKTPRFYFYPRPPRGGRPQCSQGRKQRIKFLSTPSARRATPVGIICPSGEGFLSTPSARRATDDLSEILANMLISIHALREEGDWTLRPCGHIRRISIHALREEGDASAGRYVATYLYFYPRPPRGGRPPATIFLLFFCDFYPRPPRGGRPRPYCFPTA